MFIQDDDLIIGKKKCKLFMENFATEKIGTLDLAKAITRMP